MFLEIVEASQLSDEESQALTNLDAAVYPPKPAAQEATVQQSWAHPQWHILIQDADQQLVSHVGVLTRICLCDGDEILIGGIGGVMTHPSQRRKGYAGAGLRRATEFLQNEMRVDLSLLFCGPRMLSYYRRFGFSNFAGDTFALRDGKKILFPRSEIMVRPAIKALPQCAALDLCGLPW